MDLNEEKKWFIYFGDHHEGPFSLSEIQLRMDSKMITPAHFVWAEGMTDWKLLKEIPAFEKLYKKADQAVPPKKEPTLGAAKPNLLETVSLSLDTRPITEHRQTHPDEIEKAWKKKRAVRRTLKAVIFLIVAGACGYVYQSGLLERWVVQFKVDQTWNRFEEKSRPIVLELVNRYPILGKIISPLPKMKGITPEEYSALNAAASTVLEKSGPALALAVAKEDPTRPTVLVASNLPDDARFDVYIEGIQETLLGQLNASVKSTVTISKNLGKTPSIELQSGAPLPPGEYQVSVTESADQPTQIQAMLSGLPALHPAKAENLPSELKLLSRRTYFLGGVKDGIYTQKLKVYHEQLKEKARIETADLQQLSSKIDAQLSQTETQFKKINHGKSLTAAKKASWSRFHAEWMKEEFTLTDAFTKLTPETLKNEYVYANLYEMAREASQNLQKLHDLQNDYFENRLDARGLDIQLGSVDSVAQNTLLAFKTKLAEADKQGAK